MERQAVIALVVCANGVLPCCTSVVRLRSTDGIPPLPPTTSIMTLAAASPATAMATSAGTCAA
jgi:hypothetical protein